MKAFKTLKVSMVGLALAAIGFSAQAECLTGTCPVTSAVVNERTTVLTPDAPVPSLPPGFTQYHVGSFDNLVLKSTDGNSFQILPITEQNRLLANLRQPCDNGTCDARNFAPLNRKVGFFMPHVERHTFLLVSSGGGAYKCKFSYVWIRECRPIS